MTIPQIDQAFQGVLDSYAFGNDTFRDQWIGDVWDGLAELVETLGYIADGPCQIWPHPGPTRDANDNLVWPSNCLDDLDRGERPEPGRLFPCNTCRARAALGVTS